jgi:hypothetical protein
MQGFNGRARMLAALGVKQTIDDRQLSFTEPNGPNTWEPSLANLDPSYKTGNVMRLVRLDGIPSWASPVGARQDRDHAPRNLDYYESYMARVGAETESIRRAYFPSQRNNYYQVTWEPLWRDTSAKLVSMYAAAYSWLHSADPYAVVLAAANPDPGDCSYCTATFLRTYAALGLTKYIDGVATHSYFGPAPSPSHPPEQYDTDPANVSKALDRQLRSLRAQMQAMKPNMTLWSTEAGVGYDPGVAYGPNQPCANQLYAQAAVAARVHLIVLGEGAQVTYFFFGSDYPREFGFGTFFDLVNLQGSYSATSLSPKPEALAFAAMTRIIDGTRTLGRVSGLPPMVYGYAFEQLGGGKVITALWTHNNAVWPTASGTYSPTYSTDYSLRVDSPGTSGMVTVIDLMGNPTQVAYKNGVVQLTLTESPIYVVSSNAGVIKADVIAPVGYAGQ